MSFMHAVLQIDAGFLPVGHTHEDIDAMFSLLSRYLQTHSAILPSDLAAAWRGACKGQNVPTVSEVKTVPDIKRWLESSLPDDLVGIGGFKDPVSGKQRSAHQFHLFKSAEGVAMLQSKEWSTDDAWLPADGLELLSEARLVSINCANRDLSLHCSCRSSRLAWCHFGNCALTSCSRMSSCSTTRGC